MDRSDLIFRDGCRKWHAYFERCAGRDKVGEASHLLVRVAEYIASWKCSLNAAREDTKAAERRVLECRAKEASIQLRLRMLAELSTAMERDLAERSKMERRAAAQERDRIIQVAEDERRRKREEEEERKSETRRRPDKTDMEKQPGGDNE
jgi:hypothetical protein